MYAELPSSASDAVLCTVLVCKMWVIYPNKTEVTLFPALTVVGLFIFYPFSDRSFFYMDNFTLMILLVNKREIR